MSLLLLLADCEPSHASALTKTALTLGIALLLLGYVYGVIRLITGAEKGTGSATAAIFVIAVVIGGLALTAIGSVGPGVVAIALIVSTVGGLIAGELSPNLTLGRAGLAGAAGSLLLPLLLFLLLVVAFGIGNACID
jgi:hypothetical protein